MPTIQNYFVSLLLFDWLLWEKFTDHQKSMHCQIYDQNRDHNKYQLNFCLPPHS